MQKNRIASKEILSVFVHLLVVGARLCAQHQSQHGQSTEVEDFTKVKRLRLVFDTAALQSARINP